MYIIVRKEDNVILGLGKTLDYLDNGYPRLVEEDVAFVSDAVNVFEVDSIPEGVEPVKYCYTKAEGFYINPNWKEPNPDNTYEGVSDEVFEQILSDYREKLAGEVAGNGYNS